jgi:hypothetical protein
MKCPYCKSENIRILPDIGAITLGGLFIVISIWLLIIPPIGILGILIGLSSIVYGVICKIIGKKKSKANQFCKTCNKRFFWDGVKGFKFEEVN